MPAQQEETFAARIARLTSRADLAPAAVLDGVRTWSWGDVAIVRRQIEQALAASDRAPCVGIVLRQDVATVASLLAVLGSGRCALLISPLGADRELVAELRSLGGLPVLAGAQEWGRAGVLDAALAARLTAMSIDGEGDVRVIARASGEPEFIAHPDAAVVVRTSGTTGAPRRIGVRWEQLNRIARGVSVAAPGTGSGITINVIPMYSIGAIMGLAAAVWRGRPIAILERFEPLHWAELVDQYQPRQVGIPPAGFRAVLDAEIPPECLQSVRGVVTGSAPMDLDAVREFVRRYPGIAVLNQYGSTEFGGPVIGFQLADWPAHGAAKLGSVGKPFPGVQVRLVDPETHTPTWRHGLLEVDQGRGWIRTTDLADIDEDGFVWIRGRADDVIVRGGFKVSPDQVERALVDHPDVLEAVVVGLPDGRLGQVPGAAVTVRQGCALSEASLDAFLRNRLAGYMIPSPIRVISEIPRNEMLKPLRREVVALLSQPVQAS